MRVSKETAAAHRGAIVVAAGRLFRRHGISGVAVAEITRAAGLTHGGFYGHFASKEALAGEAIAGAFSEGLARLETAPDLAGYLRGYLSRGHRDRPEDGCVMVALGTEVGRCGEVVDAVWAMGVAGFVAALARRLPEGATDDDARRARASALLAMLVGGLSLARGLARTDIAASDRLLTTLRAEAARLAGLAPSPLR